MARKRRLIPKFGEAQRQKQQKQEQELQNQLLVQQAASQDQVKGEEEEPEEDEEQAESENAGSEQDGEEEGDDEEVEEEVEEEDEEEVEEEVEEEEEDDDDESVKVQNNVDDDDEPIQKLLEPFSKDQLVSILCEAAEKHPQVAARVRKVADEDPVHRKIFVHGLGWDTTTDTLRSAFAQYGEIEDCKAVADKISGKSKGYGFILFKSRSGAYKALQQPQKKIGNRMTSCQLAAVGPVSASTAAGGSSGQPATSQQQHPRKIFVSNVGADLDPQKLYTFFAQYGEIEEGPLGLDRQTGKPKGFCLFVYKTAESARKALLDPHKNFEGLILNCQKAVDGPKQGKQHHNQQRNPQYGRNDNNQNYGGQMMGQSVSAIPFNQGAAATATAAALNPALGQALTALLAPGGLGLHNLLGSLGTAGVGANPAVAGAGQGIQGGYGNQAVGSSISPGVLGGYGTQAGLQGGYQGGSRTQHMGGMPPYTGQ